ncbi:MAG: hypothetical protein EPN45_00645 [Rhizobiaceae bacterium]|nr:MAG: hypothetical protein EPN45_00645 [Rhizobiaceae bacterium]
MDQPTQSRTRTSKYTVEATLKALKAAGIPVVKVCVVGNMIEIHCSEAVETEIDEDEGLEPW